MTRGLQITVDVPGEEKERIKTTQSHFVLSPSSGFSSNLTPFKLTQLTHNHVTVHLDRLLLTVNIVKVPEDHLHMIPL